MATYAPDTYTGDGSTKQYAVSFPYIEEDDVVVYVDGVSASFTFISSSTVELTTAPANGTTVKIVRDTDDDAREVIYSSGPSLRADQLNQADNQLFYLTQESKVVADEALNLGTGDNYDAESHKIVNVTDPTNAQDAATKNYVDTTLGSEFADLAEEWATKTVSTVDGVEFSAKHYSLVSKDWANEDEDVAVSGGEFSAKHHAAKASDSATLAQNWANEDEDVAVSGGEFSAKHYSAKSADSATAAQTAETNAETAETNAETAETNAAASASLAQDWANEAEDVEVSGGEFSAKHYAAKASGTLTNALKKNEADQTITGGSRVTPFDHGTVSSGTVVLDPGDRPLQELTNGGAFTLEPGSNTGFLCLHITNNASAGTIGITAFDRVVGNFTTNNGDSFFCYITITSSENILTIVSP